MKMAVLPLALLLTACGWHPLQPSDDGSSPSGLLVPVVGGLAFRSITAGGNHTCALTADGSAYCWGHNDSGELGNGGAIEVTLRSDPRQRRPVAVTGGLRFRVLAAGHTHTCGLTIEGGAYCWGNNSLSQLGNTGVAQLCQHFYDGAHSCSSRPVPVASGLTFDSITAGGNHTCALTAAGKAFCWGHNGAGQLGDGTTVARPAPTPVAGNLSFSVLTAGFLRYTCGLTSAGDLNCWGSGLSNDSQAAQPSLVPTPASPGWRWSAVSATFNHTCALNAAGDLSCWGANQFGQLGDGTTNPSDQPVPLLGRRYTTAWAGSHRSCAITLEGEAQCWGSAFQGVIVSPRPGDTCGVPNLLGGGIGEPCYKTPVPVTGGPFVTFAFGSDHTCGLTSGGVAYCWGQDAYAQLGRG